MSKCFAILTALGQAMVAESIRSGADINLLEMAFGDAEYTPSEGQTDLMHERARVYITDILYDQDNPAWLRIMAVLPPDIGGWHIHEAGIFAENGNLFAVAKLDGSYKPVYSDGMVKEVALDLILEVSSEANVNLTVDANVITVTRKWVVEYFGAKLGSLKDLFENHIRDKNNPHETTIDQIPGLSQALNDLPGLDDIRGVINQALKGLIAIWSGAVADIPAGWALCDGEKGTPDLRDKFIVGAGKAYQVDAAGGAAAHAHELSGSGQVSDTTLTTAQMPAHTHTYAANPTAYGAGGNDVSSLFQVVKSPAQTTSSTGGGESHNHSFDLAGIVSGSQPNLPPYYSLAYIMCVGVNI